MLTLNLVNMKAKEIFIIPEKDYLSNAKNSFREVIREELEAIKIAKEPPTPKEKFLTRKEVAAKLRISLPTLGEYVKKGIIKSSKIGSRVLFEENDVNDAIRTIKTKL